MTAPTATAETKDNWSSDQYSTQSFVYSSAYTSAVLDLLAAQAGERIFDIGCGSGEVSLEIARAVQSGGAPGKVVGADMSRDLIRQAGELQAKAGLKDVEWFVRDGHHLEGIEGGFDAAFSNAALHWMKEDPKKVAQNVFDLLKKGGRYAAEFGGHLNMVAVRSHLHQVLRESGHPNPESLDPWYFPTAESYKALLESVGFRVERIELVPRITPLPNGLGAWLDTFSFAFTGHLSEEGREKVLEEVVRRCEVDLRTGEGGWTCMYVRLRFKAWKD